MSRMWSNWNSQILPVRVFVGIGTWENSLALSIKTEHMCTL